MVHVIPDPAVGRTTPVPTPGPTPDPIPDPTRSSLESRRRWGLVIASFGAFLAFLDATIVNVCFPAIEQTFSGSSTSTLSWVLNAYNVVFAALLVAGGRLADVLGRRRTFHLGVAIFTVSSVLCASAGSVEVLIAWRVLQAVGAAMLVPASLGVVIQAASEEKRAHYVSLWGATAALAAGLGPPIGGALIELSGWRLAFLINLPLGVAAIVLGSRLVDESRSPGRRRLPDLPGVLLLALGLAAISLAIVKGPDWGWTSASTLASLVAGLLLLCAVAARLGSHPVPVVDPELLRSPTFVVANLATLAAGMGMYAYLLNHILWLSYVWHYSLLKAGLAVAPSAFVTAIVAARLGEVAQRRGYRVVAVPGALAWAAALWWFAHRVGIAPAYLTEWLPGAVLAGIGCGATLPILGSAAVSAVPGGRYATASSVVSAVRQLGGVLGVSVLVAIVGGATPLDPLGAIAMFRDGWSLSMWCFLAAGVVALGLRPDRGAAGEALPVSATATVVENPASAPRRGVETVSAFRGIAPEAAERLAARGIRHGLHAEEVLFTEGTIGSSVFVLLSGRLRVVKGGTVISELGAGSLVGELAAITGATRSATVVAVRDCELLEIGGADVREVLAEVPGVGLSVAAMLAEQVRSLPARAVPAAEPGTIAVLAASGEPPLDIARRLVELMGRHRSVGLVSEPTPAEDLLRLEGLHDRVVLVAGGSGGWREVVRRHADVVVLVVEDGHADRLPQIPGCEVVVRRVTGDDGVLALMARTGARRVHRLEPHGLGALAARLTGRSVGLALAGGGARAFAHVGVLRELERAGVGVHRVAGTSVGSYIGAAYAAGMDVGDIESALRREFVWRNPLGDYGLPRHALSRGGRITRACERVFGDRRAECLPRELVVMATDLYSREAVPLRSGYLREITRASAAVPGLLPPVTVGERVLVDGAVTGNLPVAPLVAEGVGPVVAVNLATGGGPATPGTRRPARVPSLGETMMRTLLFAAGDEDRRALEAADLTVTVSTRDIGLLEFHQLDQAIEAGAEAGRALVAHLDRV